MDKIRIAIVGIGHAHAEYFIGEMMEQKDRFTVVGYYEPDERIRNEKKGQEPFKELEMLDVNKLLNHEYDIQGVAIESAMDTLLEHAQKCLKLKVPIHMEKPAGTDLKKFEDFLLNAKKNGIPVQMGYMYRYNPAVYKCKEYLLADKIGNICAIDARICSDLTLFQLNEMKLYAGGCMYVYGCHMLDLILQMQGIPEKVTSFMNCTRFDGVLTKDCALAVLEYEKGNSFVRTTAVEANGYEARQLIICGSNGTIEIRPMEWGTQMWYTQRGKADKMRVDLGEHRNKRRFEDMAIDFSNIIRQWSGQSHESIIFPVDYHYEKELLRVILQASKLSAS